MVLDRNCLLTLSIYLLGLVSGLVSSLILVSSLVLSLLLESESDDGSELFGERLELDEGQLLVRVGIGLAEKGIKSVSLLDSEGAGLLTKGVKADRSGDGLVSGEDLLGSEGHVLGSLDGGGVNNGALSLLGGMSVLHVGDEGSGSDDSLVADLDTAASTHEVEGGEEGSESDEDSSGAHF